MLLGDAVGTSGRLSTGSRSDPVDLWKAGDGGGRAATTVTSGNVGFSTIHSTYYCS